MLSGPKYYAQGLAQLNKLGIDNLTKLNHILVLIQISLGLVLPRKDTSSLARAKKIGSQHQVKQVLKWNHWDMSHLCDHNTATIVIGRPRN